MENMELRKGEFVVSPENLKTIIENVNSPSLKATFDIAHANTYAQDLINFYNIVKKYVVHVHISDNNFTEGKTHVEIGQGSIDFHSLLGCIKESGYAGAIIIEGYNPVDPEKTLLKSYKSLKKILDDISWIKL